jgi:hypothetical protein
MLISFMAAGDLQQRPPRRLPTGRGFGEVHIHGGRGWRPQDLLPTLVQQRAQRLAEHIAPERRRQAEPGPSDWREQRH